MFPEIIQRNEQMKRNIYNSFVETENKDLQKAITVDEFNKRFGQGFEVFSPENLKIFEKAITDSVLEKGLDGAEVKAQLNEAVKDLKVVFVKGENDQIKRFIVREKK